MSFDKPEILATHDRDAQLNANLAEALEPLAPWIEPENRHRRFRLKRFFIDRIERWKEKLRPKLIVARSASVLFHPSRETNFVKGLDLYLYHRSDR